MPASLTRAKEYRKCGNIRMSVILPDRSSISLVVVVRFLLFILLVPSAFPV